MSYESSSLETLTSPPSEVVSSLDPRRARQIVWLLAASVALLMTGFGMVLPVFARRLEALGAGVTELSYITMAFALGQVLFAPLIGSLADRYGRRPPILVALSGLILANIVFLFTNSVPVFILTRFAEGAITAGLLPSAMGVVSDIMPETDRARWIGIIMGSYGVGFIFGPTAGGILFDHWGFAMPFIVSAVLALVALVFAIVMLPETHRPGAAPVHATVERRTIFDSLPRPLYLLGTMLVLDFINVFSFAFIEPQLVFYLYNALNFSATQFGMVIGAYGLAMVIGQALFGSVSDRWGRKLPIIIGFLINAPFYASLMYSTSFAVMIGSSLVAGLGAALITPALSALYLDMSNEAHRSRVMGLKESAAALGGVLGPFGVALVSGTASAFGIFSIGVISVVVAGVLALLVLPMAKHGSS